MKVSFEIIRVELSMCLDFTKLDTTRIKGNIYDLIPTTGSEDVVFGNKSPEVKFWHSGISNHGTLIQKTLLDIIKASPGWEGRTEFDIIPNNVPGKKAFIDNLAVNKALNVAICFECKRKYENTSGPYQGNIDRYKDIIQMHGSQVLDDLGFHKTDRHIFFGIFNAYGEHRANFKGDNRIIHPDDLDEIFPTCVQKGWRAFEKEVADIFNDLDIINSSYSERTDNYSDFDTLKLEHLDHSSNVEECFSITKEQIREFFKPLN